MCWQLKPTMPPPQAIEDPDIALALHLIRHCASRVPARRPASACNAVDDGLGVGVAMSVLRARPMSRGEALARARKVKAKLRRDVTGPKLQRKVDSYNKQVTRKRDQLVCVGGRVTSPKCKHSEHKKWTPTAMLKACFGSVLDPPSQARGARRMRLARGVKRKMSQRHRVNPQARSTRAKADDHDSTGSYIQKIRDAMSHLVMEKQAASLKALMAGGCDHAVVEVALDETEQKVSERKVIHHFGQGGCKNKPTKTEKTIYVQQVVPALVIHLACTAAFVLGTSQTLEAFCPMLALASKTAVCMLEAVRCQTRIVEEAVASCGAAKPAWTLLLLSDWAKSNRKLFRELVGAMKAPTALHCKCYMHMIALSIAAAAVRLCVVGPVFCGSILLHNGSTQDRLASVVHRVIFEPGGLGVLVEPILTERERIRIDRLVDLLHWDESMLSGGDLSSVSASRDRLQGQLDELKKFLCGRKTFAHVCPFVAGTPRSPSSAWCLFCCS